ncbi:MAG: class I SAM-dependent methyltransferase [Sandaracinaceae bacterium]
MTTTNALDLRRCTEPERPATWRDQFAHPTGWMGSLIGHAMAFKNRDRSRFVQSALELLPEHDVLEIGFGSGTDVKEAARVARSVAGVDPSATMLRQASRRNADAIREGRVSLTCGSATELPFEDASFDRAFAINNVQFWGDVESGMREVRRVLRPGGRAVVAIQPRHRGASEEDVDRWGARIRNTMERAGLRRVGALRHAMSPVSLIVVLGVRV